MQRLAKWFTTLSPKDKAKIVKDVTQAVLARRTRMCNFLEYKGWFHPAITRASQRRGRLSWDKQSTDIHGWPAADTKIVYRRYASLFFIAGTSSDDNELITLEIIHRYVEQMDKYYGNVCELDIIFSFTKAYYILDELLLAGEMQESSKKNVLRCIGQQDSLEDMEVSNPATARSLRTYWRLFPRPRCQCFPRSPDYALRLILLFRATLSISSAGDL